MKKHILELLIEEGLSQRQIANSLGKSQTSIRYWCKKHDLKTMSRQGPHLCKVCGEMNKNEFYQKQRSKCKKCRNKDATKRFRKNKQDAVDYHGGECMICGYNKCTAAMEFHHLDRDDKDSNIAEVRTCSLRTIKEELDKCILVCCRCHREIHNEPLC
jgi:hypothetical protein